MFNYKEEWTNCRIAIKNVEVSSWGRVKHNGVLLNPVYERGIGWIYRVNQNSRRHFLNIKILVLHHFPFVRFRTCGTWAKRIRKMNNSQDTKMKATRRCHDCGKPTNNYRCEECWAKLRGRANDTSPHPDIPHF